MARYLMATIAAVVLAFGLVSTAAAATVDGSLSLEREEWGRRGETKAIVATAYTQPGVAVDFDFINPNGVNYDRDCVADASGTCTVKFFYPRPGGEWTVVMTVAGDQWVGTIGTHLSGGLR